MLKEAYVKRSMAQATSNYWIYFFCTFTILVCRNPGLALPLIALQYHEVKLKIEFSNINEYWQHLDM